MRMIARITSRAASVDRELGGFMTCLDVDGSTYDTKKYVWLQVRAGGRGCFRISDACKRERYLRESSCGRDLSLSSGFDLCHKYILYLYLYF
jgi:N-acylglucosamine 2-epimerase